MAISTHYINMAMILTLKNSKFTEVNKRNEEYLGVLDVNVLFWKIKNQPLSKTMPAIPQKMCGFYVMKDFLVLVPISKETNVT